MKKKGSSLSEGGSTSQYGTYTIRGICMKNVYENNSLSIYWKNLRIMNKQEYKSISFEQLIVLSNEKHHTVMR